MTVRAIPSAPRIMMTVWHALLFFISFSSYACIVVDDAGQTIKLEQPAKRIISLAPDITETLFAIGGGAKMIGVMNGSDYPPAARKITRVGSYSGLDLEKMITLHPDLIVTWSHYFSRQLNVLKKLSIPIYVSEPHRLQDIPRTMRNLGCLMGTEKIANETANDFIRQLNHLQKTYSNTRLVSVFFQLGNYSLMTINKKSWINEVISLCSGKNIFAEVSMLTPSVSLESVLSANPEVIINDSGNETWKARWQNWHEIKAVREQHLFTLSPDLIDRAGPRLLQGAKQLCADLQAV